jgi:diguanylate cyclase (GGDEF)-like protein
MSLFFSLASFAVCLGSLAVCLLVIIQERPRSLMNISYVISAISGAVWALGYTIMYQSDSLETALLFYRIGAIGWTLGLAYSFLFMYYLFSAVVSRKPSRVIVINVNLTAFAFWFAAWKGWIVTSHFQRTPAGWFETTNYASPWVIGFAIWMAFINALTVIFSIMAWRRTTLNRFKRMVRMILVPSAFFGPIAILSNLVLPLAGQGWVPPLAHLVFGVLTIFVGIAILRYRMLSIEPGFVIERLFLEITDMVLLTDLDGVIRKTNHTLSGPGGVISGDLVGRPLNAVLPDVAIRGQVIFRAPQKQIFETDLHLPNREPIPVRCTLMVVNDLNDDPIGYFYLLHDLSDIKKIAQIATELQESNRLLELLSTTDTLTGIWNRAKIDEMLQVEYERFKRYGQVFSIILIDIDKFKTINDTFGHLTGDDVLVRIVKAIKKLIRVTDLFARWGGDEFLILSPHADCASAELFAERIREAVANLSEDVMKISASVGVATISPEDTLTSLFERADSAIYAAKEQGGDRMIQR